MKFGERLIQLRKEKKISQEQLAEDLGVTRQTISNWENYKNYPDIAMLTTISDKYKISLDELLKKDVEYVKEINKKMKWGSKNKFILLLTILIIVIVSVISYFGVKYYYYKRVSMFNDVENVIVNVDADIHPFINGKPTDDNIRDLKKMGTELRYAKYKNLNIPISNDAVVEERYDSKYFNDNSEKPSDITIIDGDKEIFVSDGDIPLNEEEKQLLKEMLPTGASLDPITAAMFIGNNYSTNINIFTPIKEMKKLELYMKLISLIPGNIENEDKVQEDNNAKLKYTHMLCPIEGQYLANLVPSFTVDSNQDNIDIIYNNRIYHISYTGYTHMELMNLIEFIYFD